MARYSDTSHSHADHHQRHGADGKVLQPAASLHPREALWKPRLCGEGFFRERGGVGILRKWLRCLDSSWLKFSVASVNIVTPTSALTHSFQLTAQNRSHWFESICWSGFAICPWIYLAPIIRCRPWWKLWQRCRSRTGHKF